MKHTRKVKIITARRSSWREPPLLRAHCPVCEREVETLTIAQAVEALEISGQMFDGLIAGGLVHAIRTVSGSFRVCKDSLFSPRG